MEAEEHNKDSPSEADDISKTLENTDSEDVFTCGGAENGNLTVEDDTVGQNVPGDEDGRHTRIEATNSALTDPEDGVNEEAEENNKDSPSEVADISQTLENTDSEGADNGNLTVETDAVGQNVPGDEDDGQTRIEATNSALTDPDYGIYEEDYLLIMETDTNFADADSKSEKDKAIEENGKPATVLTDNDIQAAGLSNKTVDRVVKVFVSVVFFTNKPEKNNVKILSQIGCVCPSTKAKLLVPFNIPGDGKRDFPEIFILSENSYKTEDNRVIDLLNRENGFKQIDKFMLDAARETGRNVLLVFYSTGEYQEFCKRSKVWLSFTASVEVLSENVGEVLPPLKQLYADKFSKTKKNREAVLSAHSSDTLGVYLMRVWLSFKIKNPRRYQNIDFSRSWGCIAQKMNQQNQKAKESLHPSTLQSGKVGSDKKKHKSKSDGRNVINTKKPEDKRRADLTNERQRRQEEEIRVSGYNYEERSKKREKSWSGGSGRSRIRSRREGRSRSKSKRKDGSRSRREGRSRGRRDVRSIRKGRSRSRSRREGRSRSRRKGRSRSRSRLDSKSIKGEHTVRTEIRREDSLMGPIGPASYPGTVHHRRWREQPDNSYKYQGQVAEFDYSSTPDFNPKKIVSWDSGVPVLESNLDIIPPNRVGSRLSDIYSHVAVESKLANIYSPVAVESRLPVLNYPAAGLDMSARDKPTYMDLDLRGRYPPRLGRDQGGNTEEFRGSGWNGEGGS